jgi:hypothetical protein
MTRAIRHAIPNVMLDAFLGRGRLRARKRSSETAFARMRVSGYSTSRTPRGFRAIIQSQYW